MGVINTTPDSFSDGGTLYRGARLDLDQAMVRAERMVADGAAVLDVGGESTRPGASAVSEQEEVDRVVPVIEAIRASLDIPVSVDTSKPGVMRAAVAAGAELINDVRALQVDGALEAASDLQRPVCLMHMKGQPRTMQEDPRYDDVVAEVTQFLRERMAECTRAGLGEELIVLDPGFGFGKTPADNIELLANLRQLLAIGRPLLIGISRKSTLGVVTGREVEQRMPASLAAAVMAVDRGASIVRAHDVAETVDAVRVAAAIIEMDTSK